MQIHAAGAPALMLEHHTSMMRPHHPQVDWCDVSMENKVQVYDMCCGRSTLHLRTTHKCESTCEWVHMQVCMCRPHEGASQGDEDED